MIHAFVERLCEHTVIVRVGPLAQKRPHPWDFMVVGLHKKGCMELQAGIGRMDSARRTAIIRAVNLESGLPVEWDRLGDDPPYRMVQVSGVDGKGRIVMEKVEKAPIPDVSGIFNADGTLNEGNTQKGLHTFFEQHGSGHVEIANGVASQSVNAHDPKRTDISINFSRIEK